MFSNIGKKIKHLAQFFCWIGIIASLIGGIVMIAEANSYWGVNEAMMVMGFAIIIVGSLISWISSFVLYGFGELIDQTQEINSKLPNDLYKEKTKVISKCSERATDSDKAEEDVRDYYICKECGVKYSSNRCPYCGEPNDEAKRTELQNDEWLCKNCNRVNKISENYCSTCGKAKDKN